MTGSLLPEIFLRAIDSGGLAMNGAKLYFYLTTTTTPTNTYTSSTLGTPNANPVVADSGGLFAAIFLDPAITYRVILKTSAGATIADLDPFTVGTTNAALSITAAMLQAGVAASNLGYTPTNKAGDVGTDLRLAFGATLYNDNAGYLGMPVITHDAAITFALTDAGHLSLHTDGTARAWTIPPNASVAFPVGTVLPFRNLGNTVTLTRGAGVLLRIAGSATDQNVAVAGYGAGALIQESGNNWYCTGTGLS